MSQIDDLLAALQNGVVAINDLKAISVSTSPADLTNFNPTMARAMLSITTSSGTTYYIPWY